MKLAACEPADREAMINLFRDVFSDSEGTAAGAVIGALAGDLIADTDADDIYGYVARDHKNIVGTILFTRLFFENKVNAFILSPVAVATSHQRKGIGQQLIRFGIDQLTQAGVQLIFTYGDPEYYCKIGFQRISEEIAQAPQAMTQPEGWLCQSVTGQQITPIAGHSSCVAALNKPEYW